MPRFPNLGAVHGRVVVVGNKSQDLSQPIAANGLVAWHEDRGDIGRPSGNFYFVYPATGVDEEGRLHLVWAEPRASEDTHYWHSLRLASIWTSSFDADGWTQPVKIHEGPVAWGRGATDQLARSADGRLHLALPLHEIDGGILYATLINGRWHTERISTGGGLVAYTSISASSAGPVIVVVAGDPDIDGDLNSVYVLRSIMNGSSWSRPSLVSRSGRFPSHTPRLRAAADGGIHLIWIQALTDGNRVLRHVSSRDNTLSWSSKQDAPLEGLFINPAVAIDRCGVVHVVLERWTPEGIPEGLYDFAIQHAWKEPARIFAEKRAFDLALGQLDANRLALVYAELPNVHDKRAKPTYFTSVLAPY